MPFIEARKPMKRLSLYLFLILFTLQTPSLADDIRDFQIEGMSIGDSALDYFSESHLIKNIWDYTNNKFKRIQNDNMPFFETYGAVDFHYKTNDSKYIMHAISGVIFFKQNIKACLKKMDEVINEIEKSYTNVKFDEKVTSIHPSPKNKSGKSKFTDTLFEFKNGDKIVIACYDYSKDHTSSDDILAITLETKEYSKWMRKEAHK